MRPKPFYSYILIRLANTMRILEGVQPFFLHTHAILSSKVQFLNSKLFYKSAEMLVFMTLLKPKKTSPIQVNKLSNLIPSPEKSLVIYLDLNNQKYLFLQKIIFGIDTFEVC